MQYCYLSVQTTVKGTRDGGYKPRTPPLLSDQTTICPRRVYTSRVVNWPTLFQRVGNWPTEKLQVGLRKLQVGLHPFMCRPISSMRVVSWPTKKLQVGLHHFMCRPTSSLRVGNWPTKHCKLAYTILRVGQLQVWGLEFGQRKTAS